MRPSPPPAAHGSCTDDPSPAHVDRVRPSEIARKQRLRFGDGPPAAAAGCGICTGCVPGLAPVPGALDARLEALMRNRLGRAAGDFGQRQLEADL